MSNGSSQSVGTALPPMISGWFSMASSVFKSFAGVGGDDWGFGYRRRLADAL